MKFERYVKGSIFAIIYIVCGLWLDHTYGIYMGSVMIWNVFLGCLPLVFSTIYIHVLKDNKKVLTWLSLFAWLLLFPNALYLVTDFIHTNSIDFYQVTSNTVIYYKDIYVWLEFLYIGVGVFVGTMIGLYSFYQISQTWNLSKRPFHFFMVKFLIFFASGFGIYLGRFLRLNSWDIFQPWNLISMVFQQLNSFALIYALLICIYTFFIYEVFHLLISKREPHD